jgi:hypothetical protein
MVSYCYNCIVYIYFYSTFFIYFMSPSHSVLNHASEAILPHLPPLMEVLPTLSVVETLEQQLVSVSKLLTVIFLYSLLYL